MHITGKILAWMMLIAAIVALGLAAKLVDTRGRWMKDLQAIKKQNEQTADQLAAARLQRDQARENLEREMLRWNRIWTNVDGSFSPQSLLISKGSAVGIPASTTLYAFQLAGDGTPQYVGAFQTVTVQANQADLKPAFRIRQEDVPKWNGQNWRFRTTIPSSFASRVSDLESELVVADELLAKQRSNLEVQTQLVDTSRDQRDERLAELLGARKAGAGVGLVAEISQADDARNSSLAEVDSLRRSISAARERVQQLIRENNDLARTLPGEPTSKQTAENSLPQS
jgi:hypothetical protein